MPDISVKTYDPKKVVVTIGGLAISGYADGTLISISRQNEEVERLFSEGFTVDPLFVPFLIAKRWLSAGQAVSDLTDNQVERLYNNYNQLETLFNEYKEAANA